MDNGNLSNICGFDAECIGSMYLASLYDVGAGILVSKTRFVDRFVSVMHLCFMILANCVQQLTDTPHSKHHNSWAGSDGYGRTVLRGGFLEGVACSTR